jgi:hypothetical protein
LQSLLLEIDITEIVVHKTDKPNIWMPLGLSAGNLQRIGRNNALALLPRLIAS